MAIWGTATLKTRSLTAKECPTIKGEAKPLLTPTKLKALRGMFTDEKFGLYILQATLNADAVTTRQDWWCPLQ